MSISPCNLDEINAQVAVNQIRQHFHDLSESLNKKYRSIQMGLHDCEGKTIKEIQPGYQTVLILFTDGTYLHLEHEDNYGSHDIEATGMNLHALIEEGLMNFYDAAAYKKASQDLKDIEISLNHEESLINLISQMGIERIREIVNG